MEAFQTQLFEQLGAAQQALEALEHADPMEVMSSPEQQAARAGHAAACLKRYGICWLATEST
eukprot:6387518-Amphidinium_carterae.1